jgi:hypothetical protein
MNLTKLLNVIAATFALNDLSMGASSLSTANFYAYSTPGNASKL